jgi:hypothetical protein
MFTSQKHSFVAPPPPQPPSRRVLSITANPWLQSAPCIIRLQWTHASINKRPINITSSNQLTAPNSYSRCPRVECLHQFVGTFKKQLDSNRGHFSSNLILEMLLQYVHATQTWLKLEKNNRHVTWRPTIFITTLPTTITTANLATGRIFRQNWYWEFSLQYVDTIQF